MITTGLKIKMFPDTNVQAYKDMILDAGYYYAMDGEYLVVGKPYKNLAEKTWFSYQFHERRFQMKQTTEELAKAIGVTKQTIINWESGVSMPKAEYRPIISEVTGIDFDNKEDEI